MAGRYAVGDGSIERARGLRRLATPAEQKLWAALRGRSVGDAKFRRQQRLGTYFGDFVCQHHRLVVEVDGDSHAASAAYDARRTAFLEREGYRVLRFSNADVLNNLEGVIDVIEDRLALTFPPGFAGRAPSSPPGGEEMIGRDE